MKKINVLIIAVGVLLGACSKGDDPIAPPKENQAPTKVNSLIFPTNNLLCTTNFLRFEWEASTDPDRDTLSYLLEISKDNQFNTIDESIETIDTFKSLTLEKGIAYYWRVKATDSNNLSSDYSETYQFYTEAEGEINHIPFAPELIAPVNSSTTSNTSMSLQWNCSDVDNDVLTYDVFFDTVNPPVTKVSDNQSEKSLTVNLTATTTYYWKVVAKDDKGGEAIGQVWSFTKD
tara:strand:- start:410 stop:1105 length:696 start_codon:yes stop_codon:yes gene_type:complete